MRTNHKLKAINVVERYGKVQIRVGRNNIQKLYLHNVNNGAEIIGRCPRLETVNISGDDISKNMIVKNNKHLKSIRVGAGLNALENITISSCNNLEDITLQSNSKKEKKCLKKIEISNNKKVAYIGLGSVCPNVSNLIIKNLPNLKELNVRKNHHIKKLKLVYLPYYNFWYFDCTVPYVKVYVDYDWEWVDKTADLNRTHPY